MKIGIPKETKIHEYRVGISPSVARILVERGHQVFVEKDAGKLIGFTNEQYIAAGAQIAATPSEIYENEMIVKVKEPQPSEYPLLKEGQILFCFLHLAPDPIQTEALLKRNVIGIAYETVTDSKGKLPLLTPMSEIAGRLSIQVGATCLQMNHGGRGVLLGGVPGVLPAKVTIIGGGVVGAEAARMAMGLGAQVAILDKDLYRLRELDSLFGPNLTTVYSTPSSIEELIIHSDLVIGSVLIPGKTAPKLISREMVKRMIPGSVFVDVAIDQGGCSETSRPTNHAEPTYIVDHVIHYCVTNMPGACARTSTLALTNATIKDVLAIADKGVSKALNDDPHLREGLNVCLGKVTNETVAEDLGYPYFSAESALSQKSFLTV